MAKHGRITFFFLQQLEFQDLQGIAMVHYYAHTAFETQVT